MGALREWIQGMAGAAILTAICMTVTPEGRVKKVVALVCAMAVILMMVKPVIGFDYKAFSSYTKLKIEAGDFTDNISVENEKLMGLIIEEQCAAYILDKGKELGIISLEAAVSARRSGEGYWYPESARISTDADKELRAKLSRVIEAELGIPPEELIWSMQDEE